MTEFHGAKAAIFIGQKLLVYRRDDKPGLAYANMWDFPGGGREGNETPEETLLREVDEEFGLRPSVETLIWKRRFRNPLDPTAWNWFFVMTLPEEAKEEIVFGDEGQEWCLMEWSDFDALPDRITTYSDRLAIWKMETGGLS